MSLTCPEGIFYSETSQHPIILKFIVLLLYVFYSITKAKKNILSKDTFDSAETVVVVSGNKMLVQELGVLFFSQFKMCHMASVDDQCQYLS